MTTSGSGRLYFYGNKTALNDVTLTCITKGRFFRVQVKVNLEVKVGNSKR